MYYVVSGADPGFPKDVLVPSLDGPMNLSENDTFVANCRENKEYPIQILSFTSSSRLIE